MMLTVNFEKNGFGRYAYEVLIDDVKVFMSIRDFETCEDASNHAISNFKKLGIHLATIKENEMT